MADEDKLMDLVEQYAGIRYSSKNTLVQIRADGSRLEAEIRQLFRAQSEVKLTNEHGDILTMSFAAALAIQSEQLAELQADKERLDWIIKKGLELVPAVCGYGPVSGYGSDREAIDAAMKQESK